MACDCKVEDLKTVTMTKTLPGGPPQNIVISVVIKSECNESEDDPENTGIDKIFLPESRVFQASVRLKKTAQQLAVEEIKSYLKQDDEGKPDEEEETPEEEKPNDKKGGICFVNYVVKLDKGSTQGLKITEVKLGPDTFAVEIPAGGFEIIVVSCDEACAPSRAGAVKIADPFGNFLAELTRLKICECGPFG